MDDTNKNAVSPEPVELYATLTGDNLLTFFKKGEGLSFQKIAELKSKEAPAIYSAMRKKRLKFHV
jgi:hypothetical protein